MFNELIIILILCGIIIASTLAIFLFILAVFIIAYTIKAAKRELSKRIKEEKEC